MVFDFKDIFIGFSWEIKDAVCGFNSARSKSVKKDSINWLHSWMKLQQSHQ